MSQSDLKLTIIFKSYFFGVKNDLNFLASSVFIICVSRKVGGGRYLSSLGKKTLHIFFLHEMFFFAVKMLLFWK